VIIYLKLLITMALWGGTFIAGRLVVQDMGAFSAAFCRFAIASLALLLLTYALEGSLPRLPKKLWLPIALLGLSAVGFSCYNDGLRQLGPARAGAFINLVPVFAIALAALVLQETPTSSLVLGVPWSSLGSLPPTDQPRSWGSSLTPWLVVLDAWAASFCQAQSTLKTVNRSRRC